MYTFSDAASRSQSFRVLETRKMGWEELRENKTYLFEPRHLCGIMIILIDIITIIIIIATHAQQRSDPCRHQTSQHCSRRRRFQTDRSGCDLSDRNRSCGRLTFIHSIVFFSILFL